MSEILIGTSGYDYPEWKGVFYPADLSRKDFLSYYATQFNALEINNTFYSMPNVSRMEKFIDRSQEKLYFSIKANRLLTHEISRDWKNCAEDFKNSLKPVLEKGLLKAVLFQLPQSFHYQPDNRYYLSDLCKCFEDFPVVIEFRHKEWIKESVFEGLEKRNVSVAFCDMPALKALPNMSVSDFEDNKSVFIGPNAYVRLHGRNSESWYVTDSSDNGSSRYNYDYSEEELRKFIPVIKVANAEKKILQMYFNNHPNGSGAKNAAVIKRMLKE